jgi:hypothetical protein
MPASASRAQVRVQIGLDLASQLCRRPDDEMGERMLLVHREGGLGGMAHVLARQVVDVMLDTATGQMAAGVVVTGQLLEELRMLDQLAELEDEDPRVLLVDQEHTDRLGVLQQELELVDRGSMADQHLVPDGHRQLDHLEQLG